MVVFVAALRPSAIRSLAHDRRMQIGSSIVALATVTALAYDLWARPLDVLPVGKAVPLNASIVTLAKTALGNTTNWIHQFGGAFGWSLSNPPLAGFLLLGLALAGIVFGVLLTSNRRQLMVFILLIVTALLLPVAIVASQAAKDGIVWQARDGFPLYCGVILVAGAIAPWQTWRPTQPGFGTTLAAVMRRFVVVVAGLRRPHATLRPVLGGTQIHAGLVGAAQPLGKRSGQIHSASFDQRPFSGISRVVRGLRSVDRPPFGSNAVIDDLIPTRRSFRSPNRGNHPSHGLAHTKRRSQRLYAQRGNRPITSPGYPGGSQLRLDKGPPLPARGRLLDAAFGDGQLANRLRRRGPLPRPEPARRPSTEAGEVPRVRGEN